jgi:acetoin utilization deacetylase AcuC-like enzyme
MPAETRPYTRLFYRPEYVYDALEAGIRHTFDTQKPSRIHKALIAAGLAAEADFTSSPKVSREELLLVHTPAYLDEIGQPEILAKLLFLDPEHPWDARLADPFLYAAGGTVSAARLAAEKRLIAVNLGGGYHHAQVDKAEGFCAIADVAIAIRALQRRGLVTRVLIVDLDYHHGNGNAEIFAADEGVFTFSVHAGNWCWITKRHNRDVELPSGTSDDRYLATLHTHLPPIVDEFQPDLAVYVAGSDPFSDDTLGDFRITETGMLARDRFVTHQLWGRGVPMVIVTAGGYGATSWRIHFNYFRWLLDNTAAW